jgi:hypothetical protein
MAQKHRPPEDLAPIEIDFSTDDKMEVVGITDDTATPAHGVRRVSSRPATSPVPTAPLPTTNLKVPTDHRGDHELDPEQQQLLEAIRESVEKSAQILRAVAQLCVEKQLFTRGDMRSALITSR